MSTAEVVGFMTIGKDMGKDYKFWIGDGVLNEKIDLMCLLYMNEKSLKKYVFYHIIQENKKSVTYCCRSRYNGEFCSIEKLKKIQET